VQHTYAVRGIYSIVATAMDEDGVYGSNSLTIVANTPPSVQNPGDKQSTLNVPVSLQIIATDADGGDSITFAATGLPYGLSINVNSGLISGTPTKTGNHNVTVTVTDLRGATSSAAFSWSITRKSTTPPPSITFTANPDTVPPGGSSTLSWTASDATSCTASGGWSGGRPTSGSEAVSPAVTVSYALTCTGTGGSTIRTVTVTVASQTPPNIENPGPQSGMIGDNVSLQIVASDFSGEVLIFSASGLPAGLSLNSSTGLISGTLAAAGIYNTTITVEDGLGGSASAAFTWSVSGTTNSVPAVANPGDQRGVVGQSANLQIQAYDIDGDTLSYSATGLPAGLSISAATGRISGVYSSSGRTTTTVTVNDSKGGTASASFIWSVAKK
jgi:hypothetical protein